MQIKNGNNSFFKFYVPNIGARPNQKIAIYYKSVPLHYPAEFAADRYVFRLPKNLADKLLAGDLCVDFSISEYPDAGASPKYFSNIPRCLVITDRYR